MYENCRPSTSGENETEGVVSINVECESGVFLPSALNQEDFTTVNTDEECDEDCESFVPLDLIKFAWQIARGMVSAKSGSRVCWYCFETHLSRLIPFLSN